MPTIINEDFVQYVQHPGQGFFSCCTVHLQGILKHFNTYKKIPKYIDSTSQFLWYKLPDQWEKDIKPVFFLERPEMQIEYKNSVNVVDHKIEEQYSNYRTVNYEKLKPFIDKYFTPSQEIQEIVNFMMEKYQIDFKNICVLFYRGNDKQIEIKLPSYHEYIVYARRIYKENPSIKFLIQSDETEFLEVMKNEFPDNHIIFWDEIRHMNKNDYMTVDKVYRHLNPIMSKCYLAITYIMSQCQYILCGSGNCSLWIALYRGNAKNMIQFCYIDEKN